MMNYGKILIAMLEVREVLYANVSKSYRINLRNPSHYGSGCDGVRDESFRGCEQGG